MGVLKGLWSKLTGRNREQESDLYANYDKVDTVVNEINSIATTKVMNASDEVCAAMKAINNVNGMEKYVGTIKVSNFETAFDGISDTIKSIEFFDNFYGEVSSFLLFSQKEQTNIGALTNNIQFLNNP